jgi:sugar lactone lactonase YvrE
MPEAHVLLTDLVLVESPRWHDGRLWFCHWGPDEIVAVDLDGKTEVLPLDPRAGAHSIEWLPDGRQLVVPKKTDLGRLLLRHDDGSVEPYADCGSLPSGFNEVVVDGRGNVYVNGADFDFLNFIAEPSDAPLTERPGYRPGFIGLITRDGTVRQVADGIDFPNGMVVTPDNGTLIISESFTRRLTAFDIAADGDLSNRRVWAEGIGPDGICLDAEGAVWAQMFAGNACVRVREGGQVLESIELDRSPFACMLGGPDERTLFILAAEWRGIEEVDEALAARTGQVLTVQAPAPRAGWP